MGVVMLQSAMDSPARRLLTATAFAALLAAAPATANVRQRMAADMVSLNAGFMEVRVPL